MSRIDDIDLRLVTVLAAAALSTAGRPRDVDITKDFDRRQTWREDLWFLEENWGRAGHVFEKGIFWKIWSGDIDEANMSKLLRTLYIHHLRRRGQNIGGSSDGFERPAHAVYSNLGVFQIYRIWCLFAGCRIVSKLWAIRKKAQSRKHGLLMGHFESHHIISSIRTFGFSVLSICCV